MRSLALFAVFAVGTLLGAFIGYRTAARLAPDEMPRPEAREGTLNRDDFESQLTGRTRREVVATIGYPDQVMRDMPSGKGAGLPDQLASSYDWWGWRTYVVDPANGQTYRIAIVRFGPTGTVDRFDYSSD